MYMLEHNDTLMASSSIARSIVEDATYQMQIWEAVLAFGTGYQGALSSRWSPYGTPAARQQANAALNDSYSAALAS